MRPMGKEAGERMTGIPRFDPEMEAPAFDVVTPRFRGEIWEYIGDVPMRRGYANDGKPFDIETANYLRPIFRAIKDRAIPYVAVLAAVQTLKTFACIEAAAAWFIGNDPGDMAIYIGGDDDACHQIRSRTKEWWESIPAVGRLFAAAMDNNRWDITTQVYLLPNMTMNIWGLNESSTQRVSLQRVLISDAFLAKRNGMMAQAMRRTTAHKTQKIIVESQGGEAGDDFDEFFRSTNMGALHVVCPLCGMGQPFLFHRRRADDFVAVPPKEIPSLDHAAWISLNTPLLKDESRRNCGFKRGDEATIRRADGTYDELEIMRQTYYECYHCGGEWNDTPAMRLALDHSAYYVPTNPGAAPGRVGFSWPAWAGQRLAWGGEKVMLGYLRAKQRKELFGNEEDLKQWYQKSAGAIWDPKLAIELRQARRDTYEVAAAKHDAWRLFIVVDNQLDLMTQWVVVWACKQNGDLRQIWRGALHGLAEVRKKQMEYLDDSGKPLVKDQWVFLDGRYRPEQICREIIDNRYGHWSMYNGEPTWMAWTILQGSQYEYFSHAAERDVTKKFIVGDPTWRESTIGGKYVEILFYPFSATASGQRFEIDRDGKGSEMLFLPRQEGEPADDHPLSHVSQIHSNRLVESKSYAPRAARMRYIPSPPSAPDHYFHIGRMTEAVKALWKVDGIYDAHGKVEL